MCKEERGSTSLRPTTEESSLTEEESLRKQLRVSRMGTDGVRQGLVAITTWMTDPNVQVKSSQPESKTDQSEEGGRGAARLHE